MDMRKKYIEEMEDVRFSENFERDTVRLLKEAAADKTQRGKGDSMSINTTMKNMKIGRIAAAVAAIAILMTGTVYAARELLTPSEVAQQLGQYSVAEAFDSPNAIIIDQSQQFGDYILTLNGITDGKELSSVSGEIGSSVNVNRSYAVFSLTRADGEPMPDNCIDGLPFTLSPIVNGIEPWRVSIFSLNGSLLQTATGGVRYILMETDDISIFADKGVRIAAYEGLSPGAEIFSVYPDGTTDFAAGYKGERAMFDLPLDPDKADPEAVRELLEVLDPDYDSVKAYTYGENDTNSEWSLDLATNFAEGNEGNYAITISEDEGSNSSTAYGLIGADDGSVSINIDRDDQDTSATTATSPAQ